MKHQIPTQRYVVKKRRPKVIKGETVKVLTGCGNMYVTINRDDEGLFEVFAALGKAGSCAKVQIEGISRVVTLAIRCGVPTEEIVKQLKGLQCPVPNMFPKEDRVLSCPDAIAKVLEENVMCPEGFVREVAPSKSGMEGLESR